MGGVASGRARDSRGATSQGATGLRAAWAGYGRPTRRPPHAPPTPRAAHAHACARARRLRRRRAGSQPRAHGRVNMRRHRRRLEGRRRHVTLHKRAAACVASRPRAGLDWDGDVDGQQAARGHPHLGRNGRRLHRVEHRGGCRWHRLRGVRAHALLRMARWDQCDGREPAARIAVGSRPVLTNTHVHLRDARGAVCTARPRPRFEILLLLIVEAIAGGLHSLHLGVRALLVRRRRMVER